MFIEQYYIKKKVCDDLVKFYEKSPDKKPGVTYNNNKASVDEKEKKSLEVYFSPYSTTPEFITYQHEFKKCLDKYKKTYKFSNKVNRFAITKNTQIQHYVPGGGYYGWHMERTGAKLTIDRHLVFMTYLNDIKEGGETEWYYQKLQVKPKKGLTVIWPADWTFTHRGITAKKEHKYIITGWINFI